MISYRFRARSLSVLPLFVSALAINTGWAQSITTYHYDNYRTGWNQNETSLTPLNVNSASFGVLQSVPLDDQVDAQPLYMPGVFITAGQYTGTHNVIYVATESDSVFAIDAQSGTVLLTVSLGTPIPYPLGCNENGPNVGINSTPVIDPTSKTLYVMVYTQESGAPEYMLHALDLGSLGDKVAPQLVSASHTLTNGSTFEFNATYQRQRPGLLLANGNIYAGFGSFCDFAPSMSRGWLLGWQTGTLTPLDANDLFDMQSSSPNSFFLSSVWMSGYAPSVDDSGNVLVVTGNSDPSGTTYDGVTNIQESVIKISPDLSTVLDLFTPTDWPSLDENDFDFGSGGVLVLPDQEGSFPHLAVAAGKKGSLFFMNEDNLGGYSTTGNNVLGIYEIGSCWCGQSYYVDPSGSSPRVVTSGGSIMQVYQVITSPLPALNLVAQSTSLFGTQQDAGFFTTISSNGTSNAVIWALARPLGVSSNAVRLYAFNPDSGSTLKPIYTSSAGTWPNLNGNANLVPVVANGEVFVASYKQLDIFGLIKAITTTTLSSSVNPSSYGQDVTLTAEVTTNGTVAPSGTVTFRNGTKTLGTESVNSGGVATFSTSTLSLGSNSLTAEYNGDPSNGQSESAVFTQVVNQSAITLTLTSSPNPSNSGKSVKFTATLNSTGSLPRGQQVTFSYDGTQLGTAKISAGGTASLSIKTLPVGSDVVTATYTGDEDYSSASGSVTQTVN
jgi:hypothetical protein